MTADALVPELDPTLRADLAQAILAMPSSRLVGLQVLGFAPGGRSALRVDVVPPLTFDGRAVQAGIVALLADYAGVSAAASTLPAGWAALTVGVELHNLAPAVGEYLLSVGEAVRVGTTQAVSTARVWAVSGGEATLVALATTTCRPFDWRR